MRAYLIVFGVHSRSTIAYWVTIQNAQRHRENLVTSVLYPSSVAKMPSAGTVLPRIRYEEVIPLAFTNLYGSKFLKSMPLGVSVRVFQLVGSAIPL